MIYSAFDLNVKVESTTGARGSRGGAKLNVPVARAPVVCYS